MISQNFTLHEFRTRVQARLHHIDTTQKIDATTDIMVMCSGGTDIQMYMCGCY